MQRMCKFIFPQLLLVLISGLLTQTVSAHTPTKNSTPPQAAIASASALATDAGMRILKQGGNAFDAAVAVAGVLAVAEPYNSGLGGGGFWLLYDAEQNQSVVIDSRERAPLAASENMYIDADGKENKRASLNGPLAAAIPGEPAGIVFVAKHYGRLPLARSLAPAIHYARRGIPVTAYYRKVATKRLSALLASPQAAATFLDADKVPPLGYRVLQPELANTLEQLAKNGRQGFYAGPVAKQLVSAVDAAGGIWQLQDLSDYHVIVRQPLVGHYHDMTITTVPPPSAGGIGLITMLNILAPYDASKPLAKPTVIEAMRRAYWDRAKYLGDPAYVSVPTKQLISTEHANELRASIDPQHATPSADLGKEAIQVKQGTNTTHFSILDKQGNRAAVTISLNYYFGSGFMAGDTGVILNDHMNDFTTQIGKKNVFGLVGSKANAIAPGKRPLSSMTPTFLTTPDKVAILGTPGGSNIITMILLASLDFDKGHGPESWVGLPRYHHQYLPDVVRYGPQAFTAEEKQRLIAMGYHLQPMDWQYGNMQAILWDKKTNTVEAASDPRRNGKAEVG